MSVWITILSVLFVINAVLLVILVLLQNRGGAELGIFGGSNLLNPFGSRAGDFLSNTTRILGISFMILAFLISFAISKSTLKTPIQRQQSVNPIQTETAPQSTPESSPAQQLPSEQ